MPAAGHAVSTNLHGGHGPLSLPHRTGDTCLAAHQIRVGSMCSGMGTCAHALNLVTAANPELHAHVAFFVELNRHCQEVLAADFPGVTVYDDLSDWCSELPGCDVLCAGFPCQPYSNANRRRKGSADPRAGVVDDLLAYIARVKPLVVALENVVGLLSFGRDVLRNICTHLQDWLPGCASEAQWPYARRCATKEAAALHRWHSRAHAASTVATANSGDPLVQHTQD